MKHLNLGSPETKIQAQVIYLGVTGNAIWRVEDNEARKEEKTIDGGCCLQASQPLATAGTSFPRIHTPQWRHRTLSSTHLLFPPQKRRFTLQIPTPIGESCSLVHILALLFAARTQDSRKKNNPRHREIQKLARQKWVQCAVPKTTGRCEISKAESIECFTLPTRDPRFKPQHQEKASE